MMEIRIEVVKNKNSVVGYIYDNSTAHKISNKVYKTLLLKIEVCNYSAINAEYYDEKRNS